MKEYEERIKQIEDMASAKVNELQKKVTEKLSNWWSDYQTNNSIVFV